SPRSTPFQRRRDAAAENMRRELRQQVRGSDMTQRAIEDANGFSHGYLSQVLQGHVTLTVRHLFGILMALDTPPEDFFRLFFGGSEGPISEIRERMARYDAALKQLEDRGVLSPDSGRIGDESD
ncbi:MAG: helix-turn-helix transcriptional regulator, partial [Acidobacteriota bacterium]